MEDKLQTKSMWLAAALIANGAELIHTDKTDPRHMEFHLVQAPKITFNSKILEDAVQKMPAAVVIVPTLSDYENQWANGTLTVNAAKYADAIQRLKSVIHSV